MSMQGNTTLSDFTTNEQHNSLVFRLKNVFLHTWDLGLITFGGPPVHFHIFRQRFVEKYHWIDDQNVLSVLELFAVCQALPGPASTKLGYSICLTYAGFLPALLSFILWCLPGAVGMFALAIGISSVSDTLPEPMYAFLSGLNSATVGIIAVAAVNLSNKAIADHISRIVVIGSGCAGLCYSALWYFPLLMVIGGLATLSWDMLAAANMEAFMLRIKIILLGQHSHQQLDVEVMDETSPLLSGLSGTYATVDSAESRPRYDRNVSQITVVGQLTNPKGPTPAADASPVSLRACPEYRIHSPAITLADKYEHFIPVRWGMFIVALFLFSFILVMLLRGLFPYAAVEFRLFSNLLLAGTIIFGGGPVVVPLLREYIVAEGWVSSRDFLIGLAVIHSFPGPNFNFAVFLSALAAPSASSPPLLMAVIGFIGMFTPGMVLATGVSALWTKFRQYHFVLSILRGVNAAAVGLVWTAVYRLWQVGFLSHSTLSGDSLGSEPWWVVVATVAFSGSKWFGIAAPISIAIGGVMGLFAILLR